MVSSSKEAHVPLHLGDAASTPKHIPLPCQSALSQAREFPAISLEEALIYLFNGENKQQLEKSGFSH